MNNGQEPATRADIQALTAMMQALTANVQALTADVQTLKTDVQTIRTEMRTLEARIDQKLEAIQVNWDIRFHEFEHRIEQTVSDIEGRIVTTVYRLLESGNSRLTEAEHETAAIKDRLAILENRVMGIEKRLDSPPHK